MNNFFMSLSNKLFGLSNHNYFTTQQIGYTTPDWINTTHKWTLYNEIPELQMVINRYSKMVASANPQIVDENGVIVERVPQWITDLIDRPNGMQTWGNLLYMMAINKCVTNNILVYAPKGSLGNVQALTPLAWNNVKVVGTGKGLKQIDKGGFIKEFQIPTNQAGQFESFLPEEVIYISEPDGINLFNTKSKLEALKYPLSNIAQQYTKRNVLLRNLFALGILSMEKSDAMGSLPLDKTEAEEMRKDLKKRHEGEVVITDKRTKWDPMSFPTRDLMLFEELTADKQALIEGFGLNANMFASPTGNGQTFANVENGEKQAYNATIIPDTEIIYDEMTRQMGLDRIGYYIKPSFDHISVLQNDDNKSAQALLSRSQALEKIANQLTLTDDEKRAILEL